jgi:multiple sugar transport system permease protein
MLRTIRILAKHAFLALAALIGLIPFLLILLTSLKHPSEAIVMPPKWVFTPTLENYRELLSNTDFLKSVLNSLIIAGGATIIATVLGILAGYVLSRFRLRGGMIISYMILFLRMVPPISFVIPYFVIWRFFHLADTYFAMIMMYIALALPLLIWMIRGFFLDFPVEIEEAAMVDGCTRWQMLRTVAIPAMLPGILAASMLTFISLWNEFMFALFNAGRVTRTLPKEIYSSIGYYQLDWARLSTTAIVAIIPAILFIAFTQRHLVRGLTMGAVKG